MRSRHYGLTVERVWHSCGGRGSALLGGYSHRHFAGALVRGIGELNVAVAMRHRGDFRGGDSGAVAVPARAASQFRLVRKKGIEAIDSSRAKRRSLGRYTPCTT